jgi:hypothetical protein
MTGGWLLLIADGSHRVGLDTSRTRLLFYLTVAHPARLAGSYEPMKLQLKCFANDSDVTATNRCARSSLAPWTSTAHSLNV